MQALENPARGSEDGRFVSGFGEPPPAEILAQLPVLGQGSMN